MDLGELETSLWFRNLRSVIIVITTFKITCRVSLKYLRTYVA